MKTYGGVADVSVICNGLCSSFIFKIDIICYIMLFYHYSCDVTYLLLIFCFFPFLCVAVLSASVYLVVLLHIRAVRNNNSNSGYSDHILDIGYKYGTITDTMVSPSNKCCLMMAHVQPKLATAMNNGCT
jgi:hypothetical protein